MTEITCEQDYVEVEQKWFLRRLTGLRDALQFTRPILLWSICNVLDEAHTMLASHLASLR
jgi:hypothetical protein